MDGTLEQKRKGFMPDREPWMDKVPTSMMSDEQLKLLREWDVKAAAAVEAKAKHHKALDAELRQLRVEAADIVSAADARLQRLQVGGETSIHPTTVMCVIRRLNLSPVCASPSLSTNV